MSIIYKMNIKLEPEDVIQLFNSSGIKRPVDDMERIAQMLRHANLVITAWDENKLVGIARSLTDFSYCCYLSDLAVAKEYQGKGIGKELIHKVQEAIGDKVMLLLLSAPNAMSYYPHVGFEEVHHGWYIPRKS